MSWLLKIVDEFRQERETTFLRGACLSRVPASGAFFALSMSKRSDLPDVAIRQGAYHRIDAGIMAMLVTGMLELSVVSWNEGGLGKAWAGFIAFMCVRGMIALIPVGLPHPNPQWNNNSRASN